MAKLFLTDINLNGNKLQNTLIESVPDVARITGVKGRIVLDESDNLFKYFDGTNWIAGAKYAAANGATDVANQRYGIYASEATSGQTTTLTFNAIAVTSAQALTIAKSGNVISLGLKIKASSGLTQSAEGLASTLSLKKVDSLHYKLWDGTNTFGDEITIAEDNFVKKAYLANAAKQNVSLDTTTDKVVKYLALEFSATGVETQYIDVSTFIQDIVVSDGLEKTSTGSIKVKKDTNSESFLTVSEAGIKVSGVQTAINTAKAAAKSTVSTNDAHITVTPDSTAVDGHVDYKIATKDVASASTLNTVSSKVNKNETDITDLKSTTSTHTSDITAIKGYTVNGKAISTNPVLKGGDVVIGGEGSTDFLATDTVEAAVKKVDVVANAAKNAAATNASEIANVKKYSVNGKAISTNPVLKGEDIATGTVTATSGDLLATDKINVALGKILSKINSAVAAGTKSYKQVVSKTTASPVAITAANHGCGKYVQVTAYMGTQEAVVDVTNNAGALSIAWNGTLTDNLTIVVVGNPDIS